MGAANSSTISAARRRRKSSYQEVASAGHLRHTCVTSTHSEGNLQNKGIRPLQNRKLGLQKRKQPFESSHGGIIGSKALLSEHTGSGLD